MFKIFSQESKFDDSRSARSKRAEALTRNARVENVADNLGAGASTNDGDVVWKLCVWPK
jgi:hypothetical protein